MGTAQPTGWNDEAARCGHCGAPLDAQVFDASTVEAAPRVGASLVLARFQLPPQYCGVLEYFSQFTDAHGRSARNLVTSGVRWSLRVNGRPLSPYLDLGHIVNPWGHGPFPLRIRLDDGATLELVVRGVPQDGATSRVATVGGRVVGRYWYDGSFGEASRRREAAGASR
jgi:hypothetical protein